MAFEDIKREIDSTPGLRSKMVKYGAIGAVAAIPLPLIGPVIGGLAGAALAYHRGTRAGGGKTR